MSKVKVKKIKQLVGDVDINSMFEEMMGIKDCETYILAPKFSKMRNICRKIYKILIQFSSFIEFKDNFPEFKEDLSDIESFANLLKEDICFGDSDEPEDKYNTMEKKEMNDIYKKLKENKYIKQLVILCSQLKSYANNFENINELKDAFIAQEPGLSFKIFNFSNLDLKKLWVHKNIKPMTKKYILSILHHLYKECYALYKINTSPNVDIDQFSVLLIDCLSQLKKNPELHRCSNAFKKIEDSLSLLKENFDNYYRESIASENPSMIFESFIIDVSNQGGNDPRVAREFRQIIQYMHKVSQQNGKIKDPNLQKLFSVLNENYNIMEGKMKSDNKDNKDDTKELENNLSDLDISIDK